MIEALIGGAADLLGGIISNDAASARAREQMAFQERMSSSAYQRAAEDARKAGINPILMPALGGGASSPSGALGEGENVIGPAVSTALQAVRQRQEIAESKSREAATRQEMRIKEPEAKLADKIGANLGMAKVGAAVGRSLLSPFGRANALKKGATSAKEWLRRNSEAVRLKFQRLRGAR